MPTLVCTSLMARTTEICLEQMREMAPWSDLFEIRLDAMEMPDLAALLRDRPRPVILTNRPTRQGGLCRSAESERIALLERADELGADYVDVEVDSLANVRRRGRARRIVSYHDFTSTPDDLAGTYRAMASADAEIVKIATLARRIEDNLVVLDLLRRATKPTIAIAMGEYGQISRILGAKFGAFLTYASPVAGAESAPGQMTARTLRDLYHVPQIGPQTEVYGVIAKPVSHSMSPQIHNTAFAACDLNAVYLPFLVDDVTHFLAAFRPLELRGCSVTIPHKEKVIPSVGEIDPLARQIGAVNTLVSRGDRWFGTNTDMSAAVGAMEEELMRHGRGIASEPLRGQRAVLIGTGGAGRAIAFGLREKGARLLLANRTEARARRLAAELGAESVALDDLLRQGFQADILVNASSVGMHPKETESPVPQSLLRPPMLVFDAVYNPIRTRLIREAQEAGCPVVTGLEMFVGQAVAQFELWTGRPAPRELMARVVRQRLEGRGQ